MSKKDFIALADALRGKNIPLDVLEAIMEFCEKQNPRFMRDRWLGYLRGECGKNGGKVK
jgi:hypothetical protein